MRAGFWLIVVLMLAGCGKGDSASYLVGGNRDHSLSLVREKAWYWSDWEVFLVVTRQPECMRRHAIAKSSAKAEFKVDMYDADGAYVLRTGSHWYVAETGKCQMQEYPAPPPEPGSPVGTWTDSSGQLRFVAAPAATPPAASP